MRLAIFGVPRNGTSLLYTTIRPHFRYSINEPFPPKSENILVEEGGQLVNHYTSDKALKSLEQSRDERLLLMMKYQHHDYFTKVFPHDVAHRPIFEWLMREGYEFIAVERKRPIDAVISAVIAYETEVWTVRQEDNIEPVDKAIPFTIAMGNYMRESYRIYYEFVDRGPVRAIRKVLYYEDLSKLKTRGEIMQATGLSRGTDDTQLPRLKKPRTEHQKRKLIPNMPELVKWYKRDMLPILPERAKQFNIDEYTS